MKKFGFLVVVVLFFAIVAFYSDREGDIKTRLRVGDSSYMDAVSITQKRDGIIKWILNADKAVFVTENEIKLASLRISFPEKDLTLTSDTGLYDVEKRDLKIEGNIKAATKDYDIVAKTLYWDSSTNEVMSDEQVHIVGKKFSVQGDDLVATNDKAKLKNNVKAIFYAK
ncbi:MAG: LPS export ABC transporter periplasmic protein LptC [Nitrospirota bacterium]